MADYKRILTPVDDGKPAQSYLTPVTSCFLEADGVDPKSLQKPQKIDSLNAYAFQAQDASGHPVDVQVFQPNNNELANVVAGNQAVEVAPPGTFDKTSPYSPFDSIASQGHGAQAEAVETKIIDRSNKPGVQQATTDTTSGDTTYKVSGPGGSMKEVEAKDVSDRLKKLHQKARDCLNQF